jgi:cytochrome P450 PksS
MAEVDLTHPLFQEDPYPTFARLRRDEPVARVRGRRGPWGSAWLVTRYDDVNAVLRDPRFSSDIRQRWSRDGRPPWWMALMPRSFTAIGSNMLVQDDPAHARLRNLVQKAFTPALVQNMAPRVEAITQQLLDRAEARGRVDLLADFAFPLPMTVISEILGVPEGERDYFRQFVGGVLEARAPGPVALLRRAVDSMRMLRYFERLIALRRAEPDEGLITALIAAEQAGDRLTGQELIAMVFLLLLAGHETTVNLIGNGLLALLDNRDQWDRLRADPALVRPAVEELLRYTNPVQYGAPRLTVEDVELRGTVIPRHSAVLAMLASANRDETAFAEPERLDIGREPNRHVAFGIGIHYCLGAPLARLEGAVAFATLARRFPTLRLAVPRDTLRWRPPGLTRGLTALPVQLS